MDLMLDIETFGTKPNAPIIGIGAVIFDRAEIQRPIDIPNDHRLELVVDADGQLHATADASTIYWWMMQNEDARKKYAGHVVKENNQPAPLSLFAAMKEYLAFCRIHRPEYVWCNGATFDHVIMQSAFDAIGLKNPFFYSKCLDARTIYKLVPQVTVDCTEYNLTPHSAVSDCLRQVFLLTKILTDLNYDPK